MKRRILYDDKKAVSNVLAYLFSFTIASMVMVSSVIITTNIINDKTADVAGLEAQSLANKIADALIEAVGSKQSRPDSDYEKILDVPMYLAGLSYYIEVTESAVYVNTTDGRVSKSCTTYNAGNLSIGVSSGGKIYGGSGKIDISFDEPDYVYKFDFGTGNSTHHSPVDSGYYMVTPESKTTSREPEWLGRPDESKYQYRLPILVKNPSSEKLTDVPVKIVLNPSNFDYSYANVSSDSSSSAFSDITFFEPAGMDKVTINISMDPPAWEPIWFYTQPPTIDIEIIDFSGGYTAFDIDEDTLMLNDQVSSISFTPAAETITFDGREALQSLEEENNFLWDVGGSGYEVTLSGSFKNGMTFSESAYISIIHDIYVYENGNIQNAIDGATDGDTIFVYTDTYNENILIDRQIGLIGKDRDNTIIDGIDGDATGDDVVTVTANDVYIDSFTITGGDGVDGTEGDGIYINGNAGAHLEGITVINCKVYSNELDGIVLKYADYNTIENCIVHDNGILEQNAGNGILLVDSDYNNIIDCESYLNIGPLSAEDKPEGIELISNSDYNTIENCIVHDNMDEGIEFWIGSDHNTIRNSTVYDNDGQGIYMGGIYDAGESVVDNTIINCSIYDNGGSGIVIVQSDENTITNCDISDNDGQGIYILGDQNANPAMLCEYNTITNCDIYDNENNGIILSETMNIQISNCDVHGNGFDSGTGNGILLRRSGKWKAGVGPQPTDITECNIYDNRLDGVHLEGSKYNLITECNIFDNGDDGIHLTKTGLINSNDNTIEYCNFYGNGAISEGGVGVWIDGGVTGGSRNNEIHYNNFAEQKNTYWSPYVYNAWDGNPPAPNDWDSNYWDDYTGGGWWWIPPNPLNMDNDPQDNPYYLPAYIQVDDDESSGWYDYYHVKTIQEGINHVHHGGSGGSSPSTSIWGTVKVHAGTYNNTNGDVFPIRVNRSYVKLIGNLKPFIWWSDDEDEGYASPNSASPLTEIKGDDVNDVINVTVNNVIIDSFVIKGGKRGINIYFGLAPPPTPHKIRIANCSIKDNIDGIYLPHTDLNDYDEDLPGITECLFRNNSNGIRLGPGSNNIIENCIFWENDNGLHIEGASISNKCNDNIFRNCIFWENDNDGFYMEYGDRNKIEDCTFSKNGGDGIELKQSGSTSSNKNEITNCDIGYNDKRGIYLYESSSNNTITNCRIYDNNQTGLHIEGNSSDKCKYNTITNCRIYDNGGDGIYLEYSEYTTITDCDISDNTDYGAYLDVFAKNNDIYHNKFIDNNGGNRNAQDDGGSTNVWHDGYPTWLGGSGTGGNYWSDYDNEFDYPYAAEDNCRGFRPGRDDPQPICGGDDEDESDSIADDSYHYANDWYPWCRRSVPYIFLPYYIDYWNPDGDSVILVNMDLNGNESKYLLLYYGYNDSLDESHNHTIGDVSLFFDDFPSASPYVVPQLGQWNLYPNDNDIKNNMSNSCVNLVDGEYIITKDFSIPTLGSPSPEPGEIPPYTITNESMYIIEARMKINNGQSNTFFLCQGGTKPWHKSYLVSANLTPLDKLYLHKEDDGDEYKLDEVSMPDLDHWIRMKSYAYLSKTIYTPDDATEYEDAVVTINGYLYNFTTFALEGNVSGIDTNLNPPNPIMGGKIGLGCGLLTDENSDITVDWIRVMKNPVVQPTVSIGATESIGHGWTGSVSVGATNRAGSDPFNPGPLLCDFNRGAGGRTFEIQNLPAGKYVITVTMGDTGESCSRMRVEYNGNPGTTIPNTEEGEFETKWFTIDWPTTRDLTLEFSRLDPPKKWAVNYITIERGEKKDMEVATG